jgi:hypothetical protein
LLIRLRDNQSRAIEPPSISIRVGPHTEMPRGGKAAIYPRPGPAFHT